MAWLPATHGCEWLIQIEKGPSVLIASSWGQGGLRGILIRGTVEVGHDGMRMWSCMVGEEKGLVKMRGG